MKQKCEMEECTICLINLNYNVAILSCGHKYHYSCIQDWIKDKIKIYVQFVIIILLLLQ